MLGGLTGQSVFLKMDIEGSEPAALRGGKRLLLQNDVTCSVCSYHRFNDELKIKSVLHNCDYRTSTSNGYIVFVYAPDIWLTADFRHGVIYGDNG